MRTSVVWLVLAAGCGFHGAGAELDSAGAPPPDACVTFSAELDTCALPLTTDLTLTGVVTYDTTLHALTVDGVATPVVSLTIHGAHGELDALLARDVRLTAGTALRATGGLAFAIVASGRITLEDDAKIDVAAGGAAARATCEHGAQPGQDSKDGAGGGGGGGFGATGGEGGVGNSDAGSEHAGGFKGEPVADMPAGLVGGCPGAPGGKGDVDGGAGGAAGGAIYLVAGDAITLGARATLTAGGGGGGGGGHTPGKGDAGGGGGGSGGMIVVEAPTVTASSGAIVANGGGGGEGSAEEDAGKPGTPGTLTTARAPGGKDGVPNGADGGAGGSADLPDGAPGLGPLPGGGGGGGGGIGFIRIASPSAQLGTVSPAPSPSPGRAKRDRG